MIHQDTLIVGSGDHGTGKTMFLYKGESISLVKRSVARTCYRTFARSKQTLLHAFSPCKAPQVAQVLAPLGSTWKPKTTGVVEEHGLPSVHFQVPWRLRGSHGSHGRSKRVWPCLGKGGASSSRSAKSRFVCAFGRRTEGSGCFCFPFLVPVLFKSSLPGIIPIP